MTPTPGLLTLGETLGLVATGPLAHAGTARVGIGGAESNVAIGAARLGVPATWVGRVGDDGWGERVARELRAEGVAAHVVVDPAASTAVMTKEQRGTRTRVTYHRTGSAGSRLAPGDLPEQLLAGAGVLHLTGITPGLSATALAATREALATARRAGVPVSFDVNHRHGVWRERDAGAVYRELAAGAAVVLAGPEEAALLVGAGAPADEAGLLAAVRDLTDGDVVLKLGERGCLAHVDGGTHAVPAHPLAPGELVDTVGAGDAFVAGYLAELLAGRPAAERLRTGTLCGALACTSPGDWEGLPTRAEVSAIAAGGDADPVRR
ncbi:sugar kinase [Nocardioides bruguierae]|uniref:sugar kinase n=1 Tax=Nocardioides bruguierae TaxID=2945102 RepID=UPI00201FEF2B|nr:sugar kinase [Nocardioides bruguierae]MCL8025480.1 sugar kinase [Nocardioides bruguierae]